MAEFSLKVGETAVVRPRWWGRSWSVIYAGSVGDGTYSVAVQWSMGHNSAAYNLYLRKDDREFWLPIGRIAVQNVSPHSLRFRFDA